MLSREKERACHYNLDFRYFTFVAFFSWTFFMAGFLAITLLLRLKVKFNKLWMR